MEIVLDFEITDKSGNKVDLSKDSAQMISKANIVCKGSNGTLIIGTCISRDAISLTPDRGSYLCQILLWENIKIIIKLF